jgi:Transposase
LFRSPPSRTGWRRGEKRAEEHVTHEYLDRVLADFSGYIAADELYDGPYCVLSIVDNHRFKRLLYEVLDHDPTAKDISHFFQRFQEALKARGLTLRGITTDGSPLYPAAIVEVFGSVPHQVCEFHILAELTKAVLHAVAKARRELKATLPKIGRGRPSRARRKLAASKKRIERKITDLFNHRHLFVQHHLTVAEHKTLQRITRGLPTLRTLRQIMDQAYRLFDRRCRTETALAKLAQLRQRVARFQHLRQTLNKLFSPNLEKALTFLNDSLLPATSNAVERGNRRHRKMQKTVYRVRTQQTIRCRIALDMQRDLQAPARYQTTATLHQQRRETG